jgi:hypothetical protein
MRNITKPAIALSLIAWAAFTASASATPGPVSEGSRDLTFSRVATNNAEERVWFVFDDGRDLAAYDDESADELADEDSLADDESADDEEYYDDVELPSSIPASDFERMQILEDAGLAGGGTLSAALNDLELPFAFAGREQWVRNLTGAGVEGEPAFWSVSMESVTREENALRLLLGRTIGVQEERGLSAASDDLSTWQKLVPAWAPRVRDQLAARGIPFSVELLASPEINLYDSSKPLFAEGEQPASLFQLGVLQVGENQYLRSLSAEELMLEVWPSYWRYFHRPAGAPVPADLVAGLTFGSGGVASNGSYVRSPLMSTASYLRWQAYGYPGVRTDGGNPAAYDPTGYGAVSWFSGAYADFAPARVGSETLARYQQLLAGS